MKWSPTFGKIVVPNTNTKEEDSQVNSVADHKMLFNPRVKVNFNRGDLTSDAGLLLYKAFDDKIGLSEMIKTILHLDDAVDHRQQENHDVVMQKIYQHVAGYHADDHADDLRHEPILTTILNK